MGATTTPIGEADRLDYLDILRGLAVLAIFAVNIKAMLAPFPYYSNATLWTGEYDRLVAALQVFFIEDKWRTIFTALFGAGLALIAERTAMRDSGSLGLLSRRLFFLFIFGLIHLLAIWMGDILFAYALCGFLAMWFRNAAAKTLIRWAAKFLFIAIVWNTLFAIGPAAIPEVRAEIEPFLWGTDPEYIRETTEQMLGGIGGHFEARITSASEYIFMYFLAGGHWLEMLAVMIGGMWAYRTGFFTGAASVSTYRRALIFGFVAAVICDTIRWTLLNHYNWDFAAYSYLQILNQLDGYFGAIGYSGLVGLLVKSGWRPRAVAATGRMAFTNYIACSLVGTTLAYGHGFSLFNALTNLQLLLITFATWIVILIWSPLWLAHYRFGPLEWLWRSLTYGALQPMRRVSAPQRAT
ncbi:MAG: DUF418 domain-containing protein [Marinicaulis sp.]|nr:DUF418 domain-containing protein [Marinicaulis sp.]NNL87863.1 DUF418 domain-containing protein [Marinicaulis sp.]